MTGSLNYNVFFDFLDEPPKILAGLSPEIVVLL
jgi:hypothetical protein